MNLVHIKDKLDRARASLANVREKAKLVTTEVVGTALGLGVAIGMGALDEAKGESKDNDEGIKTHSIGPIPTSLAVGVLGKVGALAMHGDGLSHIASSGGQGGLDAWGYVMGRRLWIRHQRNQNAG